MRTRALLAAAALMTLSGCGSASAPSAPSGVDELVVPTPDPDPSDFVGGVDNPWFPLEPGTRWEYGAATARLVVSVEPGREVAGVATTALVRTTADGEQTRDLYAQDERGNVWWFGREGAWLAGESGAEAGLAMPAEPRRGDGFRTGLAPGVDEVASVVAVDAAVDVPLGEYDDTVTLELRDDTVVRREVYARGVGLVQADGTGLVAYDEPR
ncbi:MULTISPECIES: hypothetical protein [unclassified Nocardioides]|uniref:hypothetical protein n=1 Tax=unclassified Nocardioides TaxID=2615069 RepID=UPI0007028500|nr:MULTISPECIES: hypothetical protein [unclassified Nocardioides]KRC46543.1 hypothetical protein ASE19_22305 [Nocardioides sp. Root79]KRC69886.1 hypothetical protein ASE20_15155 [Nocardioides sp. Root240]